VKPFKDIVMEMADERKSSQTREAEEGKNNRGHCYNL
jgi:hypothetical protein